MAGRDAPTDDAHNDIALDEAEALRLDAIAKSELEEAGITPDDAIDQDAGVVVVP